MQQQGLFGLQLPELNAGQVSTAVLYGGAILALAATKLPTTSFLQSAGPAMSNMEVYSTYGKAALQNPKQALDDLFDMAVEATQEITDEISHFVKKTKENLDNIPHYTRTGMQTIKNGLQSAIDMGKPNYQTHRIEGAPAYNALMQALQQQFPANQLSFSYGTDKACTKINMKIEGKGSVLSITALPKRAASDLESMTNYLTEREQKSVALPTTGLEMTAINYQTVKEDPKDEKSKMILYGVPELRRVAEDIANALGEPVSLYQRTQTGGRELVKTYSPVNSEYAAAKHLSERRLSSAYAQK